MSLATTLPSPAEFSERFDSDSLYECAYRSPTQNEILKETAELHGGEALAGFRVPVAQLFAPVASNP